MIVSFKDFGHEIQNHFQDYVFHSLFDFCFRKISALLHKILQWTSGSRNQNVWWYLWNNASFHILCWRKIQSNCPWRMWSWSVGIVFHSRFQANFNELFLLRSSNLKDNHKPKWIGEGVEYCKNPKLIMEKAKIHLT